MRQNAPATERNRQHIREVLAPLLPKLGRVLEVASGTGQHCAYLASQFPGLTWQPSDRSSDGFASIQAWRECNNQAAPMVLDVCGSWPNETYDAVLCINMIHIAPWEATEGLLSGAGRVLEPGGFLFLYGPYKRDGAHTAPSNIEFEKWLHSMDPRFGVRELEAVTKQAEANGLVCDKVVPMPANNFSVVFRKPS